jgi:hypothetical protein
VIAAARSLIRPYVDVHQVFSVALRTRRCRKCFLLRLRMGNLPACKGVWNVLVTALSWTDGTS